MILTRCDTCTPTKILSDDTNDNICARIDQFWFLQGKGGGGFIARLDRKGVRGCWRGRGRRTVESDPVL